MYPLLHLGSISIPTYFLVITVTVCLALIWLKVRLRSSELPDLIALDLSLVLMISAFMGARLMHVFYENPEYYLQDYRRVLYFWDGGFVFYGGAIACALTATLFLRIRDQENFWQYFDLFTPILALSYALGRIGCVFAGCCYGRSCDLPWSIDGRHPTALYAVLWELGVVMILIGLQTKASPLQQEKKLAGTVFSIWIILHGLGRFVMESFRDDFRGPTLGLSISSWISLGIIVIGLVLLYQRRSYFRTIAFRK